MSVASIKQALAIVGEGVHTLLARGYDRDTALQGAGDAMNQVGVAKPICEHGPSFAAAWAECALSTIEPSAKLVASLMATRVTPVDVEGVKPPWRCFGVDVPAGLVEDGPVFVLALSAHDGSFNTFWFGTHACAVGNEGSLADYAALDLNGRVTVDGETTEAHDSFCRKSEMLGRLLVNLCLELDNPEFLREQVARSKPRKKNHTAKINVYKVSRKVQVDVRREIRAYIDGTSSKSPTVRSLIRGHWKAQAHGPGRALRKRIHVEPYWRGPEEGPVAVRPHVMK